MKTSKTIEERLKEKDIRLEIVYCKTGFQASLVLANDRTVKEEDYLVSDLQPTIKEAIDHLWDICISKPKLSKESTKHKY